MRNQEVFHFEYKSQAVGRIRFDKHLIHQKLRTELKIFNLSCGHHSRELIFIEFFIRIFPIISNSLYLKSLEAQLEHNLLLLIRRVLKLHIKIANRDVGTHY